MTLTFCYIWTFSGIIYCFFVPVSSSSHLSFLTSLTDSIEQSMMMTDASDMLAAALEQMDGIIAGTCCTVFDC